MYPCSFRTPSAPPGSSEQNYCPRTTAAIPAGLHRKQAASTMSQRTQRPCFLRSAIPLPGEASSWRFHYTARTQPPLRARQLRCLPWHCPGTERKSMHRTFQKQNEHECKEPVQLPPPQFLPQLPCFSLLCMLIFNQLQMTINNVTIRLKKQSTSCDLSSRLPRITICGPRRAPLASPGRYRGTMHTLIQGIQGEHVQE